MPGRSGVTVVTTLVCFFISHARLRAHWAPGIPCALCYLGARMDFAKPRAHRAAGSRMHIWKWQENGDSLGVSRRSMKPSYAAISGVLGSARSSGGHAGSYSTTMKCSDTV